MPGFHDAEDAGFGDNLLAHGPFDQDRFTGHPIAAGKSAGAAPRGPAPLQASGRDGLRRRRAEAKGSECGVGGGDIWQAEAKAEAKAEAMGGGGDIWRPGSAADSARSSGRGGGGGDWGRSSRAEAKGTSAGGTRSWVRDAKHQGGGTHAGFGEALGNGWIED